MSDKAFKMFVLRLAKENPDMRRPLISFLKKEAQWRTVSPSAPGGRPGQGASDEAFRLLKSLPPTLMRIVEATSFNTQMGGWDPRNNGKNFSISLFRKGWKLEGAFLIRGDNGNFQWEIKLSWTPERGEVGRPWTEVARSRENAPGSVHAQMSAAIEEIWEGHMRDMGRRPGSSLNFPRG